MVKTFVFVKEKSRRRVNITRRDHTALNASDRLRLKACSDNLEALLPLFIRVRGHRDLQKAVLEAALSEFTDMLKVIIVDVPVRQPKIVCEPMTFDAMEAHLRRINIDCSERFRFQSFDCLRRILIGFQFPEGIIILKKGYKIKADEMLMISLSRLSFPNRWSDLYERFPGRQRWFLQAAFYWFLDFLVYNWGYLLLNNMEYWLPFLAGSNEAIRIKLQNLNWVAWRQFHDAPTPGDADAFRYAMFLDDTMMAFCRPGGNMTDGPAAPRVPLEVQQAWWTGYKKLHGLKWQSAILANGMDFQLYGPLSVRRNDLTVLAKSKLEEKLEELQENGAVQFKVHGDSAFVDSAVIGTGGGRGMASVRETSEWSFKDVKALWAYIDFSGELKLRQQPVAKIMFACFLLRNTYVSIHASQISEYMVMQPPPFEHWTAQGPRARPIPDNSIFSENYVNSDADDDSTSESGDDD